MVLEKTLESPLDYKEIQWIHSKEDQSWEFTGRTDVEAETPVVWPPDAKNWLIGKDPDTGKDWGQEEKGTTEDKVIQWHHRQWTWFCVNSRSWWWTGRPGMLQSMGSQRVGHDWATELNWRWEDRSLVTPSKTSDISACRGQGPNYQMGPKIQFRLISIKHKKEPSNYSKSSTYEPSSCELSM